MDVATIQSVHIQEKNSIRMMKMIYDELRNIHYWGKYQPLEPQYFRYNTNVVMAAYKINDLYGQICVARDFLHCYNDIDNYGDISAKDEISLKFVRKCFLETSLMYYNYAVDFIWQVIWIYYNPWIKKELPTDELYQKCMKECNFEELKLALTIIREIKLRDVLQQYFSSSNQLYEKLRSKYNYLKHRGTFYTPGLGMNNSKLTITVNGYCFPCISSMEVKLEELSDMLLEFDKQFVAFCEYIIKIIMPTDYFETSMPLEAPINYYIKHKEELIAYNQK